MSRQRDEKGRFVKTPPKIEIIGTSSSEKKEFLTIIAGKETAKMTDEETSKKGGLTLEQRREYECRMDMENKRREMAKGETLRGGPTPEQRREYEKTGI